MACYRQTGIPGKHNVVSRTLLESPEVLLQGCGIDYKKQEMLDVDQGQVGPPHPSTDDRYIQLTTVETEQRMLRSCKTVALGSRTKGVSQTVRNWLHEGGGSMHVGQWSAFR
ncbi:hypothetical protein TNCV_4042901 [Trichonephila clavipes]|nr:hypothetical protein TNCV_4042901 [Trichonephila clavipes]